MSELRFPVCPICNEAVLLPFSISERAFEHWICTNCGFCITLGGTVGYKAEKDIDVKFLPNLITKINSLKQIYQKI